VLVQTHADELKKHYFDEAITTDNVQSFVDKFLKGEFEEHYKS
jgi:hypothetical protein